LLPADQAGSQSSATWQSGACWSRGLQGVLQTLGVLIGQ
jgi:hypothetical protein